MALILEALMEVMRRPTVVGVATELVMFCGLIWVATLVGLFVGWVWRPKWALDLVGCAREAVAAIPHEGPGVFNFNSVLGIGNPSTKLSGSMSISSKGIDLAEFLIENSKCLCVGVQKKGQNAGYLLNTKTHKNFWLLA